jgi:glycosyltransferase involved in cell wall biosynthesis
MNIFFSIVVATRDRPALFKEALDSVLAQERNDIEVIVIDDGSNAQNVAEYQPTWDAARQRLQDRFQVQSLLHRPKGHGQSYSLNCGVSMARGEFVCFLDDDDKWTDVSHLNRARAAIDLNQADKGSQDIDLYMSNQDAWAADGRRIGTLWLGGFGEQLRSRGRTPDVQGTYAVNVDELMSAKGFCHLNCLIVRRSLFNKVGGMDEGIRWECDRDLFLRLIDQAGVMLYQPMVVAYHRVPDPSKAANMTTSLSMLEKRLLQSLVLDRALVRSKHPAVREHARTQKVYALQRMSEEFAVRRDWSDALYFARLAFAGRPSLGRLVHWMRMLVGRATQQLSPP